MATNSVIDIAALLAPIAGDVPTGGNIRQDASPTSIYYKIKDARAGARSSERSLLMEDDPDLVNTVVPEWATVLSTAPEILISHSKDLEVAAWYTEGLLREYGLAGLRDGFKLIQGLVEKFWDGLYPMPDEDGMETRIAPLIGLNGEDGEGTLMVPINKVFLTQGHDDSFATWNYEQALDLEKITDPKKKEARIAAGAISTKMIQQSVSETPIAFYVQFKQDLDECIEAFTSLTAVLDERCGHDAPPSSNIRNRLKRVNEVFGFLTKNLALTKSTQEQAPDVVTDVGAAATSNTVTETVNVVPILSIDELDITNRDDAHKLMLKVAEFFRETEPHSPVPYALEQAVRWGNLSLPELLSELITDNKARQDYFKMTGIPDEGTKRK